MISLETTSSPQLGRITPNLDLIQAAHGRETRTTSSPLASSPGETLGVAELRLLLDLLKSLWLAHGTPDLTECFRDAFEFTGAVPLGIPAPKVWTDGLTEVVFEWIGRRDHAIVSLEGDGALGYTMRTGGKFLPGALEGTITSAIPADLLEYLKNFE